MHELRWVWSLALGVTVGCFAEEDPDADDDGDGSTGTASTIGGTMSATADGTSTGSGTATPTSSSDASDPSTDPSTGTSGVPGCDDNVAVPPGEMCARPSWFVQFDAAVASVHGAAFDQDRADDVLVAVSGPPETLAWVLGGESPSTDAIDTSIGNDQVVVPVDSMAGDDVLVVGERTRASDLLVWTWTGTALELGPQREPPDGATFVAATASVAGGAPHVAWLTSESRIDHAPLADLTNVQLVGTTSAKAFGLHPIEHENAQLLVACTTQGFEIVPIDPPTGVLVVHALGEPGSSDCLVADLDDDGNTDYVGIRGDNPSVTTVHAGASLEDFAERGTVPLDALPLAAAAGDLDGDTDLDLVFALDGLAFLRIIRIGDGGIPEQGPRLQLEEPATSVAAGDFDGDGDTDVAYAVGNELRLLAIEP